MTHIRFAVAVPALAVLLACSAQAGGDSLFDPETMLRTSQIRPGMTGVGKSVFQGVEPEEFGIEVLGVLESTNLGGDLVLIKVLDGTPVERDCGIISGMSGSPVYIGGKLVGAVAYAWTYEKEPIGGVTPVEDMLEALESKHAMEEPPSAATPPTGAVVNGRRVTRATVLPLAQNPGRGFADAETLYLHPVGMAVACSGFSERSRAYLREQLKPYGLEVEPGPGPLPRDRRLTVDLQPGSAVGVTLVDGDFSAAATGTVTHRDGDVVLAFGHPFAQAGKVSMPLSTAWVHDVVPSFSRSMKLSSVMDPVGRLEQDRAWAVAGVVGVDAERIPVSIEIDDETRDRTRRYHVQVAQHEDMSPSFVLSSVFDALDAAYKPTGKGTSRVSFTVRSTSGVEIARSNTFYSSRSVADTAVAELATAMAILTGNPYDPQEVASVRLKAELGDENRSARIDDIYAEETVAKAGEDLHLHVVLAPQKGEKVEHTLTLPIPEEVQKGSMRLAAAGGGDLDFAKVRAGVLPPDLDSLEDLVQNLQQQRPNDVLAVVAGLPNASLQANGSELKRLPSPIEATITQSQSSRLRQGREELLATVPTEYVLEGVQYLTIAVEDKHGEKGRVPPTRPPTTTVGPPSVGPAPSPVPSAAAFDLGLGIRPLWAPAGLLPTWRVPEAYAPFYVPFDPVPAATAPTPRPRARVAAAAKAPRADEKPEKGSEKPPDVVTRQPSHWLQTTAADFLAGEAEGAAIVSTGSVELAPKPKVLEKTNQFYFWSAVADEAGNVYLGSGDRGRIHKLTPDGTLTELAETDQVGIHALALDGKGNLLAGTSPDGKLLRVLPDGTCEVLHETGGQYIWAIVRHGDDFYLGTGADARVLKLDADGQLTEYARLPAAHALALAFVGDDLYVGTSEDGVIYRVGGSGRVEAAYESEDDAISALAATEDGLMYAGTAPNGLIIRLPLDGGAEQVYDSEERVITCLVPHDGALYAGTGDEGRILRIVDGGPEPEVSVVADLDPPQVLSLAVGANGVLVAGTGNMGEVYELATRGQAEGVYESQVLDAERAANWGALSWEAAVPEGAGLDIQTRSGNTSDPDNSWSAWSRAYTKADGERVVSPAARFLQFRATLKRSDDAGPVLHGLRVVYLPANREPTIKLSSPEEGAALSKETEIAWQAEDPDEDTLTATIYTSTDGGANWSELAKDLDEAKYKWDTTKAKDGRCALRVVVSDAFSSPGDPKRAEVTLASVVVDNAPPELMEVETGDVSRERTLPISGYAVDELTQITSVEYRVGDGKFRGVASADGLLDSPTEKFDFTTGPLEPGTQSIELRARDAAGNWATQKLSVEVPREDENKD